MTKQKWEPKDPKQAFFPVELRPIFMEDSANTAKYHKLPRHLAVVDIEKKNPFAVVTDDYKLVTNQEAYEIAGAIMKKVFKGTNIDDMVCLNVIMPKTRSFCHIDLIHKTADFSPWKKDKKDKWTAFLRITNSYNRTRLLRFELGFCRWICLNGMIFGEKSIKYGYTHTHREVERIEGFVDNIGDIQKIEVQLIEKLHQLKRYYVPEPKMLPILCRTFNIKVTEDVLKKPKQVENLIDLREQTRELTKDYFSEMGPHGYAALNVLTDFASRPKGVISPTASIHSFQQKCGNWIDDFISAIKQSDFSFDIYLEEYYQSAQIIEGL